MLEQGREALFRELLDEVQQAVPMLRGLAAAQREAGMDSVARLIDAIAHGLGRKATACLDVTERIDPEQFEKL